MLPSGVLETRDAGDSETAPLLIFIEVDLLFHLLDDDMEDWGEEVAIYFCM